MGMHCSRCGDLYLVEKPRCPWCDAPNPLYKKRSAKLDLPESAFKKIVNEKKGYTTYKPLRLHVSGLDMEFRISFLAICILALFVWWMVLLFTLEEIFGKISIFLLLLVFILLLLDACYKSSRQVHRILWYKDKFALWTYYRKKIFSFDRSELYKIKSAGFGRKKFVFRKHGAIYVVDERDYPEVAEKMKKLYCE